MMKKLAVWGWWQGNNLGDNWIKKTIQGIFPYAEFIDTRQREFDGYDFVICGGGGLFIYDVIEPWKTYNQNIPFGMLGLGAEFPHISNFAAEIAERAKFFLVRDQYSLDCMKIRNKEKSFDITFFSPLQWVKRENLKIRKVFFVWRDGKELLKNEQFEKYINFAEVREEWERIIEENFDEMVWDDFQTRENNIDERIDGKGFVISGRYHGIVAAIQKGLPFIAIDICPKIRALVKECGLEEYCIKISEIDKVKFLIEKARKEVDTIRQKELVYIQEAQRVLDRQIKDINTVIKRYVKPVSVIHYGSYWMKENDVVNTMSDDLQKVSNLVKIDLKIYEAEIDQRVKVKISTPNGNICVLDAEKIIKDIKDYKPDCIILNSGGLTMEDEAFQYAKKEGVVTVGISLSDPDVFPYNGQIYADKFDLFYTNSKYSLENQYDNKKGNIRCMPFAASKMHHYYMPDIEKIYDVVVVGHARPDRLEVVSRLSKKYSVGTYGNGWDVPLGIVNGIDHVKAINSGKMYLSFSKTMAGYDNIKVGLFEAVACKQVVLTSYMEELEDYFEIGKEIICYKNLEELEELVSYYVQHEKEREEIREYSYKRFLAEHTYEKRWKTVLDEIQEINQ